MAKSVIIIGGGVAGLAAGCYAQMNGYDSQIYEMHFLPGGLCTAWERGQYSFDGCLSYLYGTRPGQPFHSVWQELGVAGAQPTYDHDEMLRVRDSQGRELIAYADPDRLEEHLCQLSPADAGLSRSFCQGIRQFLSFDMSMLWQKPRSVMNQQDWGRLGLGMLPYLPATLRWGAVSARELGNRFRDPFLRRAVPHMFGWEDIPVMAGCSILAALHNRNGGFPLGGSLRFARTLAKRYQALGGRIHYKAQVERILTAPAPNGRGKRAVGVRLYDDSVHHADWIISAADGRGTIFDLLDGEFVDRGLRKQYDGSWPIHSMFQVSLGVNRDLGDEPHWVMQLVDEPILMAGQDHNELHIRNYCFDPSQAPPGKSVLIAQLRTKYSYWQRIYGRRIYDSEQTQVSDILVDWLEKNLYPGLRGDIEVVDEATPLSYERYTGNWMGSSCGWLLTKQTMLPMIQGMKKTLPGLQGLVMAGQWVEPGGMVPVAAYSGRNAMQLICHQDRREFVTAAGQSADGSAGNPNGPRSQDRT